MALTCERHTAYIYDRGGVQHIGTLDGLTRVQWGRERDEVTTGIVTVGQRRSTECDRTVGLLAAGRHELVIFRGDVRVWEGPITHLEYRGHQVVITARDVSHYLNRMIMKNEYDNSYPRIGSVVERMYRIIRAESVRFEAQVPPINIRQYVTAHHSDNDAGTSSHTLPYHSRVYEHLEQLSSRGGLDYTVIGRAIHLWDVRNPALGQTAILTEKDFIGDTVITEYGMELATVSAMTDGKGHYGVVGGPDPFYGLVEIVETAYDEETGEDWDEAGGMPEPPSEAEMRSQAQRSLKVPPPLVVRIPENSTLNPNGTLAINELVPGVFIPLQADLPGRTVSQMQKLDNVSVEESPEGETIQVSLSPAPDPRDDPVVSE